MTDDVEIQISRQIDELEEFVSSPRSLWQGDSVISGFQEFQINEDNLVERKDWRYAFSLVKEINEALRDRVRFPSRESRESLANRFYEVRRLVSESANEHKEAFAKQSMELKDHFLYEISQLEPPEPLSAFEEGLVAAFCPAILIENLVNPKTAFEKLRELRSDAKERQEQLKELRQNLKDHSSYMLREDKDPCFEAFDESREKYKEFWEKYSEIHEQLTEADQEQKRNRLEERLEQNQERLTKARAAFDRCQENIEKLESQIEGAWSESYREEREGWLNEAQEKLEAIQGSIDKIEAWIEQDEERLSRL